jgi:uncharacterized protein
MTVSTSTESPRKPKSIAWRIACLLATYVAIAAACNGAWHLAHLPPQMHHGVIDPQLMLIAAVLLVGSILAASALTLRLFEKRPLSTIGVPFSGPWAVQLLIGLLVGSLVPLAFFLIAWKSGHAQITRLPFDARQALAETLPAFASFLLLAFNEELLFRGYLLQVTAGRWGRQTAAIATALLFGLAHITNDGVNLSGVAFTAFGGWLLAWLIMRQGSLWMAGGYHAAWNATASLALGLGVSGSSMPGSWIATTTSGPRWFSGGPYGFEASWITGLAEPIILGGLVLLAPHLPSHPQLRHFFDKQTSCSHEPSA